MLLYYFIWIVPRSLRSWKLKTAVEIRHCSWRSLMSSVTGIAEPKIQTDSKARWFKFKLTHLMHCQLNGYIEWKLEIAWNALCLIACALFLLTKDHARSWATIEPLLIFNRFMSLLHFLCLTILKKRKPHSNTLTIPKASKLWVWSIRQSGQKESATDFKHCFKGINPVAVQS